MKKILSVFIIFGFTVSYSQETELFPSDFNTVTNSFGNKIAVHGNYMVVGAPADNTMGEEAGAAYIFEKINGTWTQTAKIFGSNTDTIDRFGASVDIYGDFIVIGAPTQRTLGSFAHGAAYIFQRDGNDWSEVSFIHQSLGIISGRFGQALSIHGNDLIIGNHKYSGNFGKVFFYNYDGTNWNLNFSFSHPSVNFTTNMQLGTSVKMRDDYALATSGFGYSYCFKKENGVWEIDSQVWTNTITYIGDLSPDSEFITLFHNSNLAFKVLEKNIDDNWATTQTLTLPGVNDFNGNSFQNGSNITIFENYIIAGVSYDNDNGITPSVGGVYIFTKNDDNNWEFNTKIVPETNYMQGRRFGNSIAMQDDTLFIGAHGPSGYATSGSVYTYDINTLGIREIKFSDNVKIYPNPSIKNFRIDSPQLEITGIEIIDINGKLIKKIPHELFQFSDENLIQIDLENQESGIYYLTIITKKSRIVKKIIKQ